MQSSKINILFTIGKLGIGGKERQLIELVRFLPENKYNIILLTKNIDAHYSKQIPKHVQIINLNSNGFGLFSIFNIKKLIKNSSPNIIHSWSTTTSFIFTLIKLTSVKRNWILIDGSIRLAHYPDKKISFYSIQRIFINFLSDHIIANSYAGLEIFKIRSKGTVIYNGFDTNRISTKNKTENNNHLLIGMVARFDPMKDYHTFIKTALILTELRPNIRIICIGEGVLFEEIKSLIPSEKSIYFNFPGVIENVEDYIVDFDIAVLSTFSEGISNSILEYMAHEKPVVATGTGGTAELITHNLNGYLIPSLQIELLTEHLLKLIDNPDLRLKMGLEGKRTLLSKFSIDAMLKNYNNFYIKSLN